MTHNLPRKNYIGVFNYQGYVWEGRTQAINERHAFSMLVAGMAKRCNTTSYALRNYFLHNSIRWEVRCQS